MALRVKRVNGDGDLAARLRATREQRYLTQVGLAQELGVSPRTIQGWEAGRPVALRNRAIVDRFLEAQEAAA